MAEKITFRTDNPAEITEAAKAENDIIDIDVLSDIIFEVAIKWGQPLDSILDMNICDILQAKRVIMKNEI